MRSTWFEDYRAHLEHLQSNPVDLCIPGWAGRPGGKPPRMDVTLTGVRRELYSVGLEAVLDCDGTRAFVAERYLAHARECGSETCSDVWRAGMQRLTRFPDHPFALVGFGPRPEGAAAVEGREEWADESGIQNASFEVFRIAPEIADAIRFDPPGRGLRCESCPPGFPSEPGGHSHGWDGSLTGVDPAAAARLAAELDEAFGAE